MGTLPDRLRSRRRTKSVRAPSARSWTRRFYRRRIRPAGREVIVAARRALPVERMRPTFLIIGARKAGTTSLHNYLVQHPRILPGIAKEIAYFDQHHTRSFAWYLTHFPRRTGAPLLTGEATPSYLHHPAVPPRAREALPDARLIVLLRDPVQRAYSHYQHSIDMGFENLSLEGAIEAESERLREVEEAEVAGDADATFKHRVYGYIDGGVYHRHLSRWLEHFPQDRLLVLDTGELRTGLEGALAQIAAFLDIDPWVPRSRARLNVRRYPPMPEQVAETLRKLYRPHNEQLCELLNREFSWAPR